MTPEHAKSILEQKGYQVEITLSDVIWRANETFMWNETQITINGDGDTRSVDAAIIDAVIPVAS